MLPHVKAVAALVHAAVPELVLEGGVFEIVTKAGVEQITIPADVLGAFGLPAVPRKFNYAAMFGQDWKFIDHWGKVQGLNIILDPISRSTQPCTPPHAPCAMLYLVAIRMEC